MGEFREGWNEEQRIKECKSKNGKFSNGKCTIRKPKDEPYVEFQVGGRYGYSCVDIGYRNYLSSAIVDTVICGLTRKEASIIATAMNETARGYYDKRAKQSLEYDGYVFLKKGGRKPM